MPLSLGETAFSELQPHRRCQKHNRPGKAVEAVMSDPVEEFVAAMAASGITPAEPIAADLAKGKPVRFRAEGDRKGRRNGWAWLHLDGVPAGVFRHYKLGIRATWCAGRASSDLTRAEKRALAARFAALEAQRAQETQERQAEAARGAQTRWLAAGTAQASHPYLVTKGLYPFGVRQAGHELLVPMVDDEFRLWNVQRIQPDGAKFFVRHGRTEGLFWPHGVRMLAGRPSDCLPLVIGEGFSTIAAIHQATGKAVAAAMNAGNLLAVAKVLRRMFPRRELILAADDDCHLIDNPHVGRNIGMEAARKAAESIGGRLATPRPSEAESACTARTESHSRASGSEVAGYGH